MDRAEQAWRSVETLPMRRMGLYFVLWFVFIRFSLISEILTEMMGARAFIVMLFGPPTILLCVVSGGILRTFRTKASILYGGYLVWLILTIPFSVWKGGTVDLLKSAFMTEFSMFFMVAGLVYTIREVELVAKAISLAGTVDVLALLVYGHSGSGRFSMPFGTLQNPNDLAIHLIVIFPFVLGTVAAARSWFWRLTGIPTIIMGLYFVLLTGSRTALLVLAVIGVFVFFRASMTQRMALLGALVIGGLFGAMLIPKITLQRYMTIFGGQPDEIVDQHEYEGAIGSTEARQNLLKNSLRLTLENPLFGVGPGMFAVGEADQAQAAGRKAAWQVTHNTYTEVSSESGLPAFFFFVGSLLVAMIGLNRVLSFSRRRGNLPILSSMSFHMLLSLFGFSACIFFGSMAYRYYMPSLIGLAAAFLYAADREVRLANSGLKSPLRPVPEKFPRLGSQRQQ
jgi:O-antigen ligase